MLGLAHPSLAAVDRWAFRETSPGNPRDSNRTLATMAFGSCSKQYRDQSFWSAILNLPEADTNSGKEQKASAFTSPDAWIWMGDVVYPSKAAERRAALSIIDIGYRGFHDAFLGPGLLKSASADCCFNVMRPGCPTQQCIEDAYRIQTQNPVYRKFVESIPFVDGTWDDHDYGVNDGGGDFSGKETSQKIFLDFLNVPKNSPRRQRKGVYSSHVFPLPTPSFKEDGVELRKPYAKVILLDTRYHRDQPFFFHRAGQFRFPFSSHVSVALRFLTGLPGFHVDHAGDILGEEQWRWLREQFEEETVGEDGEVRFTILVSSIQVLNNVPLLESWNLFPKSKKRLIDLILSTKPPGLIILSGDVHMGQLLGQVECVPELTSSGLTHSVLESKLLSTFVTKGLLPLFRYDVYKKSDKPVENTPDVDLRGQLYTGKNFGTLQFFPRENSSEIFMIGSVRDLHRFPRLQVQRNFEHLSLSARNYSCLNDLPLLPQRQLMKGLLIDGVLLAVLIATVYCVWCSMRRGTLCFLKKVIGWRRNMTREPKVETERFLELPVTRHEAGEGDQHEENTDGTELRTSSRPSSGTQSSYVGSPQQLSAEAIRRRGGHAL